MAGLVLALVAAAATLCAAELDYARVHLVDTAVTASGTRNFLFRSNFPGNETDFEYDKLMSMLAQRLADANFSMPEDPLFIDIDLDNAFNGAYWRVEEAFWRTANSSLGRLVNWPLGAAGLLPPSVYPPAEREKMALNGSVWDIDKLPERLAALRDMLTSDAGRPQLIVVHCVAGCDRTGEVIGGYRMQFGLAPNATAAYAADVAECGRAPNYFSTNALEWMCVTLEAQNNAPLGDCLHLAKCKPFGPCTPPKSEGEADWD